MLHEATARVVPVFSSLPTIEECRRKGLGGFRPDPQPSTPTLSECARLLPWSDPTRDERRDVGTDAQAAHIADCLSELEEELFSDPQFVAEARAILALRRLIAFGPDIVRDVLTFSGCTPATKGTEAST